MLVDPLNKSAGRLVDARRSTAQILVANLSRDVVELFLLAVAALHTNQSRVTAAAGATSAPRTAVLSSIGFSSHGWSNTCGSSTVTS